MSLTGIVTRSSPLDGIIRIKSGGNVEDQVKKQKTDYACLCSALSVDEKFVAVGGDDNNVHIFEKNNQKAVSLLNLRDYLRANPDAIKRYEEFKHSLYEKHGDDYIKYRTDKKEFLDVLNDEAAKWRKN